MLEVVSDLCGLHAQVMSSAELTLWARIEGLRRDDVRDALWKERTLVKTWAMRGTLHLLPARTFATWLAANDTRRSYTQPSWLRAFGVTAEQLHALLDAISHALAGEPRTRAELADEIARVTRSAELGEGMRHSWGPLLRPAAFQGRLCFGPDRGRNVTFTRPDVWLGALERPPAEQALAYVTRAFLSAHGPATREDLARWWGTAPAPGGRMIAALGDEAVQVDVAGTEAWALAGDVEDMRAAAPARTVRLLPGFDQYVIGATRHAAELMPGPHRALVYRDQGWVSPVLAVDGRMEGVWRYDRKGARLAVSVQPFRRQPAWVRRGVQAEAEALASYLGGRLDLMAEW